MSKTIYEEQFSHLESNQHFLKRYLKIIKQLKIRNLKKARGIINHHILPRSFGGLDDDVNMVYLTLKEHFLIHHLLWKAFPGNKKMRYAFFLMSHNKKYENRITARVFEQLKNEFDEQNRKPRSAETRQKIADALKGKTKSPEHRQNMSVVRKGKPAHNKGKPQSEEQIKKYKETCRLKRLAKLQILENCF